MHSSQSNSSPFLVWHRALLAGVLILCSSCADRTVDASRLAGEADQALQAGALGEAREQIAAALAERDDIPELYIIKGRIELASNAYGNAYAAYANALSLDSTNVEALQAVSQLGLRAGNLHESLDATEKLLALRPDDPSALVTRGVHAFLQRRFPDAVSYAERVLKQDPNNEEARILKSRALFMAGQPTEAMAAIQAADNTELTAGIVRTRLELHRELRDPQKMQQDFDLLRTLLPDDADLRLDEADLHFKRTEVPSAKTLIANVLANPKASPDSAVKAIRILEAYRATLPEADVSHIAATGSHASRAELARYFIDAGQPDLADRLLRGLADSDVRALQARAEIARKNPAGALRIATAVLKSDATQCDALIAASQASLAFGRTRDALRHGQRAAAECPQRAQGWIANAAAYEARREPANADRVYRDGLEANPQNFALTFRFSTWLAANGREREALAVGRTFTRKSPALLEGWSYYRALCVQTGSDCVAAAERGLAVARTLYGPDEESGKLPTGGLFGRLSRRT